MNIINITERLSKACDRIIKHINDDHSNRIFSTLNAQNEIKDENAKMEKHEADGYFASLNRKLYI